MIPIDDAGGGVQRKSVNMQKDTRDPAMTGRGRYSRDDGAFGHECDSFSTKPSQSVKINLRTSRTERVLSAFAAAKTRNHVLMCVHLSPHKTFLVSSRCPFSVHSPSSSCHELCHVLGRHSVFAAHAHDVSGGELRQR